MASVVSFDKLTPALKELIEEFVSVERLDVFSLDHQQYTVAREPQPLALLHVDTCVSRAQLCVNRDPRTGKITGVTEKFQDRPIGGLHAKNSLSLQRAAGPVWQPARGVSGAYPFWPGGFDLIKSVEENDKIVASELASLNVNEIELDRLLGLDVGFSNLLTKPPGFEKGHEFSAAPVHRSLIAPVTSFADIMSLDGFDWFLSNTDFENDSVQKCDESTMPVAEDNKGTTLDLDESAMVDSLLVEVSSKRNFTCVNTEPQWAVQVNLATPVLDFDRQVPQPAFRWDFQLDDFQKQAILRMEGRENVFVAAHTSAGKTVVAEYAIALAKKHMTRAVYTSPIKALSNQKFRDFKQTFGDVGLITGDVQIAPEAACVVMTTEILRSMLYRGAELIRDLEWVIFDEVHYINDAERGVVWEEVLILLPDHVRIIMLSATVPNTMEFAAWVGRIKRKPIHVISTLRRPVPLEHYLFTGSSKANLDELFLLVDADRNFITQGYSKSVNAKKERQSKFQAGHGPKGGARLGDPRAAKTFWLGVVELLSRRDKLPAVCFLFSKGRIDETARQLLEVTSLQLLNSEERNRVHILFSKYLSKLRVEDRDLPQIKFVHALLQRGLAIHHSGVLPFLKETVEMLFSDGCVKLLFATETFAMGVNMPARTVLFEDTHKHDGVSRRCLLPGEYTQMAGRAGRRGLDDTGTVIILCRRDVPPELELKNMILGKATPLESRFRLTYSMLLNLLRVEQLRVEDMMSRSFCEFHGQQNKSKHQLDLVELKKQVANSVPLDCPICAPDIEEFCKEWRRWEELRCHFIQHAITHPTGLKDIFCAGRIVVLYPQCLSNQELTTDEEPVYHLAVILKLITSAKICNMQILTLHPTVADIEAATFDVANAVPRPVLSISDLNRLTFFVPEGSAAASLLTVPVLASLYFVTTQCLKLASVDRLIDDFAKRKQARFRDDPPSQSVQHVTQELQRLAEQVTFSEFDVASALRLRDPQDMERLHEMNNIRSSLSQLKCLQCFRRCQHMKHVAANLKLRDEIAGLKWRLSEESLSLRPEYRIRLRVLKQLRFVDFLDTVELKGRVACEMNNHEVLLTELLMENALDGLEPDELAAVLSAFVFEQKRCSEPELTERLISARKRVEDVVQHIDQVEKELGLRQCNDVLLVVEDDNAATAQNNNSPLCWGLAQVVLEWARKRDFRDIVSLTDVQEGIIVRTIQRLDELLKDVRNAARIIGDPGLRERVMTASQLIKRDIVFATSLYI